MICEEDGFSILIISYTCVCQFTSKRRPILQCSNQGCFCLFPDATRVIYDVQFM